MVNLCILLIIVLFIFFVFIIIFRCFLMVFGGGDDVFCGYIYSGDVDV